MKKIMLLLIAGTLISLPACKKGENDPFLSLASREARLAGDYTIDSWTSSYSTLDSEGDKIETITVITGNAGITTQKVTPEGDATTTSTRNISVQVGELIMDKDGSWSMTFNTTTTWTDDADAWLVDSYSYTQVATSIQSGTWAFLTGQGDDFKNKERIMLTTIDVTTTEKTTQVTTFDDGSTFTNVGDLFTSINENPSGETTAVYEIDMLKGKEMTFVQDKTDSAINMSTSGGITFTYSVTGTGNVELKLSEK